MIVLGSNFGSISGLEFWIECREARGPRQRHHASVPAPASLQNADDRRRRRAGPRAKPPGRCDLRRPRAEPLRASGMGRAMQARSLPGALFHQDHGAMRLRSGGHELSWHRGRTAKCLMRGMDQSRNLGPELASLPAPLADRVANETGLPSREVLSTYLSKLDLEWDFAAYLWLPVSRANGNDPAAPMARYFVLHDTSGPNFGHRSFPRRGRRRHLQDQQPEQVQMFGRLGKGACRDQPFRRHAAQSRAGNSLARDQIRAGGEFQRRAERPLLHVELISRDAPPLATAATTMRKALTLHSRPCNTSGLRCSM